MPTQLTDELPFAHLIIHKGTEEKHLWMYAEYCGGGVCNVNIYEGYKLKKINKTVGVTEVIRKCQTFVSAVMNLQIPYKTNFLITKDC
jgi:hypothetical protein